MTNSEKRNRMIAYGWTIEKIEGTRHIRAYKKDLEYIGMFNKVYSRIFGY